LEFRVFLEKPSAEAFGTVPADDVEGDVRGQVSEDLAATCDVQARVDDSRSKFDHQGRKLLPAGVELLRELVANHRRQRWACGGYCNHDIAGAVGRGEHKITRCVFIHVGTVNEKFFRVGIGNDGVINLRVVGDGKDDERAIEMAWVVMFLNTLDIRGYLGGRGVKTKQTLAPASRRPRALRAATPPPPMMTAVRSVTSSMMG